MRVELVGWRLVGRCDVCGGEQAATVFREPGAPVLPWRETDRADPCPRCALACERALAKALEQDPEGH